MLEFGSLADLAHHLTQETVGGLANTKKGLEIAAEMLEREAKSEIGTYQAASGSFGAWPELAESTKADRLAKGYTENDPLLRSGELRDSIVHEVEEWEATVGSTSPIMEFQELGTAKIPPRPVLGIALSRCWPAIQQIMGNAAASAFVNGGKLDASHGYDFA